VGAIGERVPEGQDARFVRYTSSADQKDRAAMLCRAKYKLVPQVRQRLKLMELGIEDRDLSVLSEKERAWYDEHIAPDHKAVEPGYDDPAGDDV
jgi:hypothetical protein